VIPLAQVVQAARYLIVLDAMMAIYFNRVHVSQDALLVNTSTMVLVLLALPIVINALTVKLALLVNHLS